MTIAYRSSCYRYALLRLTRLSMYAIHPMNTYFSQTQDQLNPYTSPVFKELNRLVLSLDFIDSYHTYLKSLQDTTYYLEARNLQLLDPILMYRRAAEMGRPAREGSP